MHGQPAPPPLDLVQEFVNTRAITRSNPHEREELSSPEALLRWWQARGELAGAPEPSRAELAMALEVREGLRAVLATHNAAEQPGDERALERLARIADELPLRVDYPAGPVAVVEPVRSGGFTQVLAELLARTVRASVDGSWARLKACRDPHCREIFYDTSKNRSGAWCSMRVCGSRAKQRRFAARNRTG
ncbi:MAG TPA: CGNR zinc finger domain-containing protein [Pseudonocardia sp.]|jgi:predicted RNA-binding Zn ribbon-like protein|nr:CGNR zinc finger domain-containing protein [Pseudonocardia sp.]